jgi:hypothetical protein
MAVFTGTPPPPGYGSIFSNPIQSQYITQPAPTSINFIGIVDFTKAIVRSLSTSITGSSLSVNSGAPLSLPNLVNTTGAGGIGITNPVSGNIQFKLTNTQGTDPRIPTSDTQTGSTGTNSARMRMADCPR